MKEIQLFWNDFNCEKATAYRVAFFMYIQELQGCFVDVQVTLMLL